MKSIGRRCHCSDVQHAGARSRNSVDNVHECRMGEKRGSSEGDKCMEYCVHVVRESSLSNQGGKDPSHSEATSGSVPFLAHWFDTLLRLHPASQSIHSASDPAFLLQTTPMDETPRVFEIVRNRVGPRRSGSSLSYAHTTSLSELSNMSLSHWSLTPDHFHSRTRTGICHLA
jgi:hypothetical protein